MANNDVHQRHPKHPRPYWNIPLHVVIPSVPNRQLKIRRSLLRTKQNDRKEQPDPAIPHHPIKAVTSHLAQLAIRPEAARHNILPLRRIIPRRYCITVTVLVCH